MEETRLTDVGYSYRHVSRIKFSILRAVQHQFNINLTALSNFSIIVTHWFFYSTYYFQYFATNDRNSNIVFTIQTFYNEQFNTGIALKPKKKKKEKYVYIFIYTPRFKAGTIESIQIFKYLNTLSPRKFLTF